MNSPVERDMANTATARRIDVANTSVGNGRREGAETGLDRLREFLEAHRMKRRYGPGEFEAFEKKLHERVMELERDVLAQEMAAADVDAEAIEVEGKTLRRVLRSSQSYMTAAGEVVVERWLYKDRSDEEARCVSPMEALLGVVEGFWTPQAAKQGAWVVTQMTPQKAQELFQVVGNMAPSKTSLDRLPKALSERWEADRERFEQALRDKLMIPQSAVSVAVSIDGVLAPMEGTEPTQKRQRASNQGKMCKGPVGYKEVGCATLSFCDEEGKMIAAIRMARAPEEKKRTLKASLAEELAAILRTRPDLQVVKVADAGGDNWEYLSKQLPQGHEVIDFFHASEHLHTAIAAAYGDATRETTFRFGELRARLRDEPEGVERVIRALLHLRKTHPNNKTIARELEYFRKNRKRMQYAALVDAKLPIGSGVVEAACKTLVAQRLKLSGMRWGKRGAQAILTLRGWDQSERFEHAWAMLAATYQIQVHVLANVRPLKRTTSG